MISEYWIFVEFSGTQALKLCRAPRWSTLYHGDVVEAEGHLGKVVAVFWVPEDSWLRENLTHLAKYFRTLDDAELSTQDGTPVADTLPKITKIYHDRELTWGSTEEETI